MKETIEQIEQAIKEKWPHLDLTQEGEHLNISTTSTRWEFVYYPLKGVGVEIIAVGDNDFKCDADHLPALLFTDSLNEVIEWIQEL